jgi:hypothetical protein
MVAAPERDTAERDRPVPAPELSFTVAMPDSDGKWRRHGDYAIWCGSRKASEPGFVLHEWSERGVIPIPHRAKRPILHRIVQGTPYHVAHLFGFWIAHDVDAVWIEADGRDATNYTLMVGGSTGKPADTTCLWVCPKCAASFGAERINTAREGYGHFLDAALKRVRAFNADPALRACPKCRNVHPPTYGFYAGEDTAAERSARDAG